MKNQTISKIIFALVGIISFGSCTLDNDETTTSFFSSQEFDLISNSLSLENTLPNYSSSEEENRDMLFDSKALLGRVLFYDEHLSIDNSTSCASCHDQKLGFADDKAFSEGIDGQLTERNSIAFSAVGADNSEDNPYFGSDGGFGASMFWDHRVSSVTEQLKETIENDIEMGMPLNELEDKLNTIDYYQILFRKVYSEGADSYTINQDDILDALLKFMQSLNPSNSKFDQFHKSQFSISPTVQLTNAERRGLEIYNTSCASCHGFGQGQPAHQTENNGLDLEYSDVGDGNNRFKIPALRNIALSGPYMHDGRFETLEEVIEHYSFGIRNHENLSLNFKFLFMNNPSAPIGGFQFSNDDKDALLQFLHTLTDESFINDERFSSPF